MDMLGHDYVSVNAHGKTAAHGFETLEEQVVDFRRVELGLAVVTAEREEVGLARLVKATESASH
jgi:hypothetical protein